MPKNTGQSLEYSSKFSLAGEAPGARTVLYFYPRDNTAGCTAQAIDFTAHAAEFRKLGVRVLGVSQDSLASHEKFRAKHSLGMDLLSDPAGELCDRFEVIKMKSMYGHQFRGIERSTFVLDSSGNVLREWRKVRVPGHVREVLDFLAGNESGHPGPAGSARRVLAKRKTSAGKKASASGGKPRAAKK